MAFFWIVRAAWHLISFVFIFNSTTNAFFIAFTQDGLPPQFTLGVPLYTTFKHLKLSVQSSSFMYLTDSLRHVHWVLPHTLQISQIQTYLISFTSPTKSTTKLLSYSEL